MSSMRSQWILDRLPRGDVAEAVGEAVGQLADLARLRAR